MRGPLVAPGAGNRANRGFFAWLVVLSAMMVVLAGCLPFPPQPAVPGGSAVRIQTGAPGGATAWGTLTVTGPSRAGYVTVYPCESPTAASSSGNFQAGQTVATFVAVRVDPDGSFCARTTAPAHLIFDLAGSTTQLQSTAPQRLRDTRGDPVVPAPGSEVRVATGAPNTTLLGTLTAVGVGDRGYLTAYACDTPAPEASNVNYPPEAPVANLVAVRTDSNGEFCVRVSSSVHVVFDRVGVDGGGLLAVLDAPVRRFDSRLLGPIPPAGGSVVEVATGSPDATVIGNLTVTGGQANGYLTAFPCAQSVPRASNVNYTPAEPRANMIAVRTDAQGRFCVLTSAPAHVIFDEFGSGPANLTQTPVRLADSRLDWSGPSQVITVDVESPSSTWGRVSLWERGADGRFQRVHGPIFGWVGEAGVGKADAFTARTPAGVWTLTQAFGIKANPGTRLPYFKVDQYDWWNGDSNSPDYNTRFRGPVGPPNSEHLLSYGKSYWYSVVMDYNVQRTPYAGAAFFLHVANGEPTGGCVSVSEADMVRILRWLDPQQNPVISIGVGADALDIVTP